MIMTLVRWTNHPVLNEMLSRNYEDSPQRCYSKPSANVREKEDAFSIELAVPGLSKNDFNIDLDKNLLTISAGIEKKDEDNNYNRMEFDYSNFCRSFSLPETINTDNIKAVYKNGILKVNLPKKEEAIPKPARTIEIS